MCERKSERKFKLNKDIFYMSKNKKETLKFII